MMRHQTSRWIGCLLILAGLRSAGAFVQPGQEGSPLSIGTLRKLHSQILKEDRLLSIRLPSDYGNTRLSYPVVYLLYGDHTEGYFAETVFSLERLEGGAEIPEFILENPFWAHENCRNAIKTGLRHYAAKPSPAVRSVFINTFDKTGFQDHSETTKALVDFLQEFDRLKPAELRIWRRYLEDPTFVPSLELKQPLRTIFAGFYPPTEMPLSSLGDIQAYYREAGRRFGFEVDPPAFFLAIRSDDFSRAGRTAAAREVLEHSLSLRPEDTNAAFRLANLFFGAGDLDQAEAIYRRLQERRPDPFSTSRLEAIQRMRQGSAAFALSQALKDGLATARTKLTALEKSEGGDLLRRAGIQRTGVPAVGTRPRRSGPLHIRSEHAATSRLLERPR